jgi:hypothetical protein
MLGLRVVVVVVVVIIIITITIIIQFGSTYRILKTYVNPSGNEDLVICNFFFPPNFPTVTLRA